MKVKAYSKRIIIRAINDWKIAVNEHITGRKDVPIIILYRYAQSVFHDRYVAKQFVQYVKALQKGGKPRRPL